MLKRRRMAWPARHRRAGGGVAALLTCVALIVAACGSPRASARPIDTREPTAAPTPTAPPTATPTATVEPAATCDPETVVPATSPISATLEVRTPRGGEEVPIDVDEPAPDGSSDPATSPDPTPAVDLVQIGTVLGGTEVEAFLFVDAASAGEVDVTESMGMLTVSPTGAHRIDMTSEGNGIRFALPDLDGPGSLSFEITWTVDCVLYTGTAGVGLTVIPASVAAGCPTTGDGLAESIAALRDEVIQVGRLDVPIGILGWTGRWVEAFAVDEIPQFATWDRDLEIDAAPGASVVVQESIADVQLQSIRAPIYRRAEVDRYLEPGSAEELIAHTVVRRSPGPLGRVGIPVPLEPGSYVMEVLGVLLTPCLQVETYNVVSVEVR